MKDVQSLVVWPNDRANSGSCLGNKYSCFWAPSGATSSPAISVLLFRDIPSWPIRKTHHWSFILTECTQVFRNCQVPCWFRYCRGKRQADPKCLGPAFFNSPALIYLLSGELFANSWCLQHSWFAAALLVSFSCQSYLQNSLQQLCCGLVLEWILLSLLQKSCFNWYAAQKRSDVH